MKLKSLPRPPATTAATAALASVLTACAPDQKAPWGSPPESISEKCRDTKERLTHRRSPNNSSNNPHAAPLSRRRAASTNRKPTVNQLQALQEAAEEARIHQTPMKRMLQRLAA